MSLNVTSLSDYTKQNQNELVTGVVTGSVTAKMIKAKGNVMPDVKNAETINVMDTDAVFQDGSACGFTANGSTSFTQRQVTVGAVKINEAICLKDLQKKYLQLALPAGSTYDSMIFAETYSNLKMAKIAASVERGIWQGDKTSGNANLNKWDGFNKLIDLAAAVKGVVNIANAFTGTGTVTTTGGNTAVVGVGTSFTTQFTVGDKIVAGGIVQGVVAAITDNLNIVLAANSASATAAVAFSIVPSTAPSFAAPYLASAGITAANVIALIDTVYASINPDVLASELDPAIIWIGYDVARTYNIALKNANMFHYTSDKKISEGFVLPGTDIVVMPTPGLTGTNRIHAMQLGNMFLGCDMVDEEEKFEIFYAKEADEIRFVCEFKEGVNFAFPVQITTFKAA